MARYRISEAAKGDLKRIYRRGRTRQGRRCGSTRPPDTRRPAPRCGPRNEGMTCAARLGGNYAPARWPRQPSFSTSVRQPGVRIHRHSDYGWRTRCLAAGSAVAVNRDDGPDPLPAVLLYAGKRVISAAGVRIVLENGGDDVHAPWMLAGKREEVHSVPNDFRLSKNLDLGQRFGKTFYFH